MTTTHDDPICTCGYRRSAHDADRCPCADGYLNVDGKTVAKGGQGRFVPSRGFTFGGVAS